MCFAQATSLPSEVIDTSHWKINLPFDLVEISQQNIGSYADAHFRVPQALVFKAPVEGVHTNGSHYARSELREMNPDDTNAAWDAGHGVHVMDLTQRVTHLPVVTPKVVCGQIHNVDYLYLTVLTGKLLQAKYVDTIFGTLDSNYQLGTWFDLSVRAINGTLSIYYNGQLACSTAMVDTGCYFKAGCYVQSSTDPAYGNDAAGAYAEVEIASLRITHE
jgi:Alginate lyase